MDRITGPEPLAPGTMGMGRTPVPALTVVGIDQSLLSAFWSIVLDYLLAKRSLIDTEGLGGMTTEESVTDQPPVEAETCST